MELKGLTFNSEQDLNDALLNLARKMKIERKNFWILACRNADREIGSLNQMTVSERVDWLIQMGRDLYKK